MEFETFAGCVDFVVTTVACRLVGVGVGGGCESLAITDLIRVSNVPKNVGGGSGGGIGGVVTGLFGGGGLGLLIGGGGLGGPGGDDGGLGLSGVGGGLGLGGLGGCGNMQVVPMLM